MSPMEAAELGRFGGYALKDITIMQQLIVELAERVDALSAQINHLKLKLEFCLN